jgi:hypothetical protein
VSIQANQGTQLKVNIDRVCKKPFSAFESLRKKDEINLADHPYDNLQNCGMLNGASIGEVKKIRYDFKNLYQPIVHANGVYCKVKEKLKLILPLVYKKLAKDKIIVNDFKLKFCVDGTNVGNNKTFLNFNFSILNEQKNVKLQLAIM